MKKIYCLVYTHRGEVVYASKSKKLLEEILMDEFMDCYQSEMQEAVDNHWINMDDITAEDRKYARQNWDSLMRWVNSTYKIQKVEVI